MIAKIHSQGIYRTNSINGHFGQIKKVNREWQAEIRRSEDGIIIRFAGNWSKKSDAIEECGNILEKM